MNLGGGGYTALVKLTLVFAILNTYSFIDLNVFRDIVVELILIPIQRSLEAGVDGELVKSWR